MLYFSTATLALAGIAFVFIYYFFSENREEQFQMRQKEKIANTLRILSKIRDIDSDLIDLMDQLNINDLYDEKLLLFDSRKLLIYSSVDNISIPATRLILSKLTPENKWIETKDGLYDVIGTYIESDSKTFYGISKAYDTFGYYKLRFLKYVLIITFISISVILILVSYFLSKKITEQLAAVTQKISEYQFEGAYQPIEIAESKNEVAILAHQFNKLMRRMNELFSFQKHAVHHISHELKTPVSILVSNFEKIESEVDLNRIKELIKIQKENTKNLSEIINVLLEIAKAESGNILKQDTFRVDEILFDVAEELSNIYPDFIFKVGYSPDYIDEKQLTITANALLIKSAIMNLMQNCILYSSEQTATATLIAAEKQIRLVFENRGNSISEREIQFLFQHFYRGQNSKGKRGFGLGLVLVHRTIELHGGNISYSSQGYHTNVFTVTLPLS